MTDAGLGQSTCVGIGGDPVIGTQFLDVLELFAADPETEALVLIGEIGGAAEEEAAAWAAEHMADVPKVAFIAGRTAPEGKRMGHAGAIISGGRGTAASKVTALEAAGFRVASSPTELPALLREAGYRADDAARRHPVPVRVRPLGDAEDPLRPRRRGCRGLGRHGGDRRPGLGGSSSTSSGPTSAGATGWPRPASPAARARAAPRAAALGPAWEAEWAALDAWLPTLADDWLARRHEGVPLWQMLAHVVNHGTQHRSEAAAILTGAGRSPVSWT